MEPEQRLIELVAQALSTLEDEGEEALETLLARHPEDASVVRRRLALLIDTGLADGFDQSLESMPDRLGDFRLLRPIGGGGMGVVWLAEQVSLGREVALKLIRPDQLLFTGTRERFQREVETIARLQHPGIVPVYAVGEERGVPYFAMERVRGISLAEALKAVRNRDPATLTGSDLLAAMPADEPQDAALPDSSFFSAPWTVVCTRIAREVAEALEHARRRGVVHRDVKPSNIMLTRSGRVLLLDFGLSSRIGAAQITKTGSAVGSLAYMAPEMLEGKTREEEDPRQDVYSLGVTLYELLAIASPFAATSELDLRRKILAGDVDALRRKNTELSWELTTIVSVAMDREPGRRYATTGRLARDLGNALDRRPIEARPPSPLLRAKRWIQRNPIRAAIIAAVVFGPSTLFTQEWRNRLIVEAKNVEVEDANDKLEKTNTELEEANANLERALEEARAQTALAGESFSHALDAVDRMLTRVGEHRLSGEPRMERIRSELVSDALEFYAWFLARDEERGLRHEVARVAREASTLHGLLDDLQKASDALDQSEELLTALLDEDPEDVPARLAIASTHEHRAHVYRLRNQLDQAAASAEAAIEMLESIDPDTIEESDRWEWTRRMAGAYTELGQARDIQGRSEEGETALAIAVEFLREVAFAGPSNERLQYNLARALDQYGALRARRANRIGHEPDRETLLAAAENHEEAATILRKQVKASPELPEPRFRLARTLNNQLYALSLAGDYREELGRQAREIQEELFEDFPHVLVFGIDLAITCVNLAGAYGNTGDFDRGREPLERGLEVFERVVPLSPNDAKLRASIGSAYTNLGGYLQTDGDLEGALEALNQAREHFGVALSLTPNDPQTRGSCWFASFRQAEVLNMLGRPVEAAAHAEDLLERGPALVEIETFAKLLVDALDKTEPQQRDDVLRRAAKRLAEAVDAGVVDMSLLFENAYLSALMTTDGFEAAFDDAL